MIAIRRTTTPPATIASEAGRFLGVVDMTPQVSVGAGSPDARDRWQIGRGTRTADPIGQPTAIIARGPPDASCHHDRVSTRPFGAAALTTALAAAAAAALPSVVLAHGAIPPEPPSVSNILFGWHVEPLVAGGIVVAAVVWLGIVRRVGRLHPGH